MSGPRRARLAINDGALRLIRMVGQLVPADTKRRALKLRPASVTWHMPEYQIAFVHIPKVATTSVRVALSAFVSGREVHDTEGNDPLVAEAIDRYARHLYPSEIRKLSRACYTVAFVRDPLDRLLSTYSRQGGFRRHQIPANISFADFVHRIAELPDQRSDRHIRSQHAFITDRQGIVVEHVGRFEQLESEWNDLMGRFGFPALPKRNTSTHGPYQDAYTPALARIAAERYRRDIEFFGYEEEIARLL
jgi:dermatan 4-sulfotransferase 1